MKSGKVFSSITFELLDEASELRRDWSRNGVVLIVLLGDFLIGNVAPRLRSRGFCTVVRSAP